MKLLYGSQNFGYDNSNSDKDWLEFIYPSWNDIVHNNIISKELHNTDYSCTKLKDIRLIPKMIKKQNFNDLQFLFSQEMYDCTDLKWFFDNKQKLIKLDMWQCFCSNIGYVKSQLKENTPKSITRAYVFTKLLYLNLSDNFIMCDNYFSAVRFGIETDNEIKNIFINTINDSIYDLENEYSKFKHMKNTQIEQEMYNEIERLLKLHLK